MGIATSSFSVQYCDQSSPAKPLWPFRGSAVSPPLWLLGRQRETKRYKESFL